MSKLNQWILNFAVLASCFSISGFKIETLLNHANSDVRNAHLKMFKHYPLFASFFRPVIRWLPVPAIITVLKLSLGYLLDYERFLHCTSEGNR